MSKKNKTAISPTRTENYPEWYQQVIKEADLAENAPVRGCMVIKPQGFAIWENMQRTLDDKFKQTGHSNAYFPLLIPMSFIEKEAEHVEGFAKECAVVTHHKLAVDSNGKLVPAGEIEPLIIRPTSETIIGHSYSKWVNSYRDLPILINQWANVMRWEMRPRLFLRTSEFLWQEGHTVHETAEEARQETLKMLDVYEDFAHRYMAMPVTKGEKTPNERFPGAVNTYTIEAIMQDGKALQAGTSHFLGQNFAKASNIKFLNRDGKEVYAWTTSWGVSTRLIGGMIMTHSDDDGLVIPPRLAPHHVVILPIYRNDQDKERIFVYCRQLAAELNEQQYYEHSFIRATVDERDLRGGEKFWQHVKKGTPIRVEVGSREIESGSLPVSRRDESPKQKQTIPKNELVGTITKMLDDMHNSLFNKALHFRETVTKEINSLSEFEDFFQENADNKGMTGGGVALCHWSNELDVQEKMLPILEKYKVSARCIPFQNEDNTGKCIFSGKSTNQQVIFARAY